MTKTLLPDAPPDLTGLAVDWLDAILASADVETIGVTHWWSRATSALAAACASADTFGHAVTIAAGKLQVDVLSQASARELQRLGALIDPLWETWRIETERDAVYVVALTRLKRQARSAARTPARPAPPTRQGAVTDEEPEF